MLKAGDSSTQKKLEANKTGKAKIKSPVVSGAKSKIQQIPQISGLSLTKFFMQMPDLNLSSWLGLACD